MISPDQLLLPISPQNECGDDISYDPAFLDLETAIFGKPETQFSQAEPPDWKSISRSAQELLGRSKHLRVAMALTAALVRTDGFCGFRDGLTLLHGLVERYWEPLYPRLDPEDNNDPTERINILSALAAPIGINGDPYGFINALRDAPLAQSVQLGRFSLNQIAATQAPPPAPVNEGDSSQQPVSQAPSMQLIDAAFQDTNPEALQAAYDEVFESLNLVKALSERLGEKVGLGSVPVFDELNSSLREILRTLQSKVPAGSELAPEAGAPSDSADGASTPAGLRGAPGAINSREDVVRTLNAICAYYQQREPSSPVPLLLERAKRLATMNFLAAIEDLNPEALVEIYRIAGIR